MPRKAAPPDLNTQGGRLMSARLAAEVGTRPEAAEIFGMSKSTYESHENGNRATKGIPIERARQYARRYKVSLNWLLTGQGDRHASTSIEVRGYIGAGAEIEDFGDEARFEDLGILPANPDDVEWYEVKGSSMFPRVSDGEFIAFWKRQYEPEQLLRQECLVLLDDGKRFFKKLMPGSAPGLFDLISYNDDDRPDERVARAGKVAFIISGSRRA